MLPAKEQKAFEKIAESLKSKVTPDMGAAIQRFLANQGIDKQVKPFFIDCFEELENKVQVWSIPTDRVQKILDFMPDNWKTTIITDGLVLQRLPEKDWHKYRDSGWIGEHSKAGEASVEAAASDFEVKIVQDSYDSQQGRLVYEIAVEADFSDLAKKLEGTPEESIMEAIEEAFSDGSLLKELDRPIWDYLRHKHSDLSGSSIEVDEKPSQLKDLTNKTKFVFKVTVSYDPPQIDEVELAEKFKTAFKGVV